MLTVQGLDYSWILVGNIILTVVDYITNITVEFSGFYVIMGDFSEDSFICFIAIRILVSIVNRYILFFYGVGIGCNELFIGCIDVD